MLSRVAEAIYWMFRYVERAENVARFVDVNLHLMLDMPVDQGNQWLPLITVTGDEAAFKEKYDAPSQQNVIQFLTFDTDYPNSIASCLHSARENARSVREIISSEMWEQINRFFLMIQSASASGRSLASPHQFFSDVKMQSHLLNGLTEVTMSHGEGWHFGRIGALVERADKTSRILDVKYFILLPKVDYVDTPYDNIQWAAVLKSASAHEMYRKRYHRISPRNVANFLLLDHEFPRAIHHCIGQAEASLHTITGSRSGTFANDAERRIGRMRSDLDYADIDEIIGGGMHEYLDGLQASLNRFGDAMNSTFFAFRPTLAA